MTVDIGSVIEEVCRGLTAMRYRFFKRAVVRGRSGLNHVFDFLVVKSMVKVGIDFLIRGDPVYAVMSIIGKHIDTGVFCLVASYLEKQPPEFMLKVEGVMVLYKPDPGEIVGAVRRVYEDLCGLLRRSNI